MCHGLVLPCQGGEAACPSESPGTAGLPGLGVPASVSGLRLGCCSLLQVFAQRRRCFQVGFPEGNSFRCFVSQSSLVMI